MFKNVIAYRATALAIDALGANEALESAQFVPCGASQEKSIGWVPPRGDEHGPLLEVVAGQWIMRLMIETRTLPGSVIDKKAKERVAHIEATTGRTPSKKETREIKDDIKLELMPMAFSKESSVWVWIDPAANLLVIDAASQGRADEVVTMLVKCIPGLALRLIETKISPAAAMSEWLTDDEPYNGERTFEVGRECELKASDESKAVVKYGRHPLDIEEVAQHIRNGKLPTKLAMTWDSRVSFMLTEGLQVKKLEFLDVVFTDQEGNGHNDSFDADVTIATSELSRLLPDLLDALGGEVKA